ncbi:MAG: HAMP domain-containing histidine kinase [Candidatus Omnitrophica bacterium]|nr:HAMP domain-containing histidine kinase [Candidatus Omnitrophota bacterium]MBU4479725.1 HAMP domain-containing histidine kinase [Candidatus Omnitrophota bacterium]MCG2703218.1 HAMP domain-containing histidine kinase [Candidatus Omnitrophota bacterium]
MEFIVHDLRNPIAVISIILDHLLLIDSRGLTERQKEDVNACKAATKRMATLINSILDLSRLENKKMSLEIKEVNVEKLLESALDEVSVFAKSRQIKLEKRVETQRETFYTDYRVMVRVLVNLLSNAIKVSLEGSEVSVIVNTDTDTAVKFSVIDQGPGIPKNMTDKIFDKFVQLKNRNLGVAGEGSGLGLTFCKLAVEELDGRIWIDSEEGKGTAVRFTLPAGK